MSEELKELTRFYRFTESTELSGRLIPEEELNQIIDNFTNERTQRPAYTSVYSFGAEAVEYFNTHKTTHGNNSLSGYDGPAIANHLIFDFDSQNDMTKALEDAVEVTNRLLKIQKFNQDSVSVFFSGGKGFHVKVKISDALTNDQLKSICGHIAEGLQTFDPKIYNKTRLIRIVNTKHEKTGLYKVEIPVDEFLVGGTVEEFMELAKEPSQIYDHSPSFLPQELLNLAPKVTLNPIQVEPATDISELNFSLKPYKMEYCKYAILNGFFPEGSRNAALLSMAAWYKNQGYPMEVTNQNLWGIVEVQEKRYPPHSAFTRKEIWDTIISYVYGPNYKNAVPNCRTDDKIKAICMSTGMHDKCCGNHTSNLGIQTIEQLDRGYTQYINSLGTSLIKTGISFIDKHVKLIKGTSNYVAGRSGSGKTNLILSTLRNTNKAGVNSIFFSADTSAIIVYQRMVASVTGLKQQEVEDIYNSRDKKRIAEFKDKVSKVYGRTTFNVKSTLTIDTIRDSISEVESQINAKVDFVIIDYNERVMNQFSDPMNSVRHTALNLVDISRELDKCFLTVAQVSRTKGTERTPLLSKNAAKESGAVEESANSVVNIWRPLYGSESLIGEDHDEYIGICIAKNRMGREGISSVLHFDGSTSIVRDASDDEKKDCEYYQNKLLEREADENSGN